MASAIVSPSAVTWRALTVMPGAAAVVGAACRRQRGGLAVEHGRVERQLLGGGAGAGGDRRRRRRASEAIEARWTTFLSEPAKSTPSPLEPRIVASRTTSPTVGAAQHGPGRLEVEQDQAAHHVGLAAGRGEVERRRAAGGRRGLSTVVPGSPVNVSPGLSTVHALLVGAGLDEDRVAGRGLADRVLDLLARVDGVGGGRGRRGGQRQRSERGDEGWARVGNMDLPRRAGVGGACRGSSRQARDEAQVLRDLVRRAAGPGRPR